MYVKGDWWMICDRCGFAFRKSRMKETWDGLWVCKEDWEPKHPQLSIKAKRDDQRVPVVRPDKNSSIGSTTLNEAAFVDSKTIALDDASTLSDGDSIGVTLDDGVVQWLQLDGDPTTGSSGGAFEYYDSNDWVWEDAYKTSWASGGTIVTLTQGLWANAASGNVVLLPTVADVSFLSSTVTVDDL